MTRTQKTVAWVSIIGAGIGSSLVAAIRFFPDLTPILTAGGGLVSAVVAFVLTREKKSGWKG